MTEKPAALPNPFFTPAEHRLVIDALEMAARSYRRSQTQRPEFEMVAKQIETDIKNIISKMNK